MAEGEKNGGSAAAVAARFDQPAEHGPSGLSAGLLFILSIACGVSVATIYFPQAITLLIASDLHVPAETAALVVTTAQLGYALGLLLLVPLGDRFPHRPLVATLLTLTAAALLIASQAPTLPVLALASMVTGITTVVPQILLPMAAGLMPPERRGAVTGTLLSGLLAGILLARTFGGFLGEHLGWRGPYFVAAAALFVFAILLGLVLPRTAPTSSQRYPSLVAAAFILFRDEPELRRSCLYQALMFGGFTAAWTSLALLLGGPLYHLGGQAVGLIALVGAASVLCTPIAGRLIDRKGPDFVSPLAFVTGIAAAIVLLGGGLGGMTGLLALTAGMLLLDIAVQSGQTANQARVFAIRPDARSRLNTAYMTCVFLGGSAGSWIGVKIYGQWGWPGVCALIAVAATIALARHAVKVFR
ncbi:MULTISPECIES: MFS transporter [unclassified Mesorhizobium]|uniref:MFS transporter n=1 Tax=unclassified Mesorhizobium TaxID=325217 RepID=UPI001AEF04CA|nr:MULTISPECIES: MFS transporter [unclassified Mesorhizobium]